MKTLHAAWFGKISMRRLAFVVVMVVLANVLTQTLLSASTRKMPGFLERNGDSRFRPANEGDATEASEKNMSVHSKKVYLVNTRGCKIQSIDPFHPSLKDIYILRNDTLRCDSSPRLINLKDGLLSVDPELIQQWPDAQCYYKSIYRDFKEVFDRGYREGQAVLIKLNGTSVQSATDEFLHVSCESRGSVVFSDFLTQINFENYDSIGAAMEASRQNSSSENNTTRRHKIDEKLNIIMLGVDSTSRLNSHRQFARVRNYLLDQLGAYELLGYNRVGDNTFQNMCPLFMGLQLFSKDIQDEYFDDRPFVWKSYQKAGYTTLSAHDTTDWAPFNYQKMGFSHTPFHHYYRPMSYVIKERLEDKPGRYCCGRKPCYKWNLDYLKQFLDTYNKKRIPSFSWVFNVDLSHNSINTLGLGQDDYLELLQWFRGESDLRNNSVLIFFSDHGRRYGPMRQTYIGRYAENLPMMFLVFPEWFGRKYPRYANALRSNEHKLTSPYDIHETLRDLCTNCALHDLENTFGVSLLDGIPETRTCSDAGIPQHFCACREDEKLSTTDENAQNAGREVSRTINRFTASKDVCAVLSLSSVVDAYKSRLGLFTVTVETQPGGGKFQATVSKQGDQYYVMGDISRVNQYGNTSSCITDDFFLSKLCYCKSNIRTR